MKNVASARMSLATMRLNIPNIFKSTAYLACAAVTHCNKFLRVNNKRVRVRIIASDISHAWYAKNVSVNPICHAPRERSDRDARKWLLLEMPPDRGCSPTTKGMRAGIATISRIKRVHIQTDTCGNSQPTSSVRNMEAATRVRRKLSSIFQR